MHKNAQHKLSFHCSRRLLTLNSTSDDISAVPRFQKRQTSLLFWLSWCVFLPRYRFIVALLKRTNPENSAHVQMFIRWASIAADYAAAKRVLVGMIGDCRKSVVTRSTSWLRGQIRLNFISVKVWFHIFKVHRRYLMLYIFAVAPILLLYVFVCSRVVSGYLDQISKVYMLSDCDICTWIVRMSSDIGCILKFSIAA